MNGPPKKEWAELADATLEIQAASKRDIEDHIEAGNFGQPDDTTFEPIAAVNSSLSEIEEEYLESLPVVCIGRAYNGLLDLGVTSKSINGDGQFGALNYDTVVFLEDGRFEFARYAGWFGAVPTIVVPLFDEFVNLTNLVAWSAKTRRVALWRGWEAGLGLENLYRARLSEPLVVHDSILAWLKAERRGLFILNDALAADRLQGFTLGVTDSRFGRDLRKKLTLPPPAIVVSQSTGSMVIA